MNIRTDLAIEAKELYFETALEKEAEVPGIVCREEGDNDVRITTVEVLDQQGAEAIGKGVGHYITLEIQGLSQNDPNLLEKSASILATELGKITKKKGLTMVVGLGNSHITPDSLGPKVMPRLVVTRHLFSFMPDSVEKLSPVCALAPGVLGLTGIETGEIIRGVIGRVKPDQVIVIDALASRRTERVGTTIQIADTGISPGSGVGNSRKAINAETMGVPVIAIGVPMVVDAPTIASDTIDHVIETLASGASGKFYAMLQELKNEERYRLIYESLPKEMQNMIVTPKDIDAMADRLATLVANGINQCLHPEITKEEISAFVG
ncbi:MAG: GPR endopeptidase [Clostridia bacterium]|nr:GPR endopeptidase [Clostridia bacterium]